MSYPTTHSTKTALALFACLGCAASKPEALAPGAKNSTATAACDPDADRRAILAMAGSYDVEFDFTETEVLTPGYEKHPPHKSYATELVIPIESGPERVSLQHLLQLGDGPSATVIKHWRQDWVFEDHELFEFRGHERWKRRELPAEVSRCAWTQAVYGVDDAPRYDGVGRWVHGAEGSVWESNETWRPLPRREYTTRNDYDVLVAVNRHRITKDGWQHEQDNSKLVLEPRHLLVREHGVNRYTRTSPKDTAEAAAYWRDTAPFWAEVRRAWQLTLAQNPSLTLQSEAAGKLLHETLFARAERKLPIDRATQQLIRDTLAEYVVPPAADAASTPAPRP